MKRRLGFVCITILLCCSLSAFSALKSIQNVTFTAPVSVYYFMGDFSLTLPSISANVQTWGSPYDYAFRNLTLSFSPCALDDDRTTAGGQVIGDFVGGATLTLTGELTELGSTTVIDSGTLLVADMVVSSSGVWTLSETGNSTNQITSGEGIDFVPSSGLLKDGIDVGGGDSLVIGDMALKLQFNQQTIPNFENQTLVSASAPVIQIAAVEVPEPMTLLLLSTGALAVFKRKK